jgi:excisionase family DNA binding protein
MSGDPRSRSLSVPAAARALGVHRDTVQKLILAGVLEAVDVSCPGAKRRHLRVTLAGLERFRLARTTIRLPKKEAIEAE